MKKICSLALYLIVAIYAQAQNLWSETDIPDSLKREAHSVIRDYQLTVTAQSQKSLTMHHHMVVTILSKKGDEHALWNCPTSKFEKLTSFSGKIYDARGNVMMKLKKSDIRTSQYSENLVTDIQQNYVSPLIIDYPCTVEYDWEMKSTDGYMEYAFFSPIDHERQALQHAQFCLTVPSGTQIRYTGMQTNNEPQKKDMGKNVQYTWEMNATRGIIDDEYEDHAMYILPSILAMPLNFVLGESAGTLDSWESLGKWYAQLAEGRGTLSAEDKQKVAQLTAGCSNDREKIAALYKYLGEKTRYVSIQLGIGGWQPMKAEEVGKTGFGDCKALTNYMQALLHEAGIESYQTIISSRYENLLKGYPNMHQTDHVVLTVPQADGGTLMVECTNPQLPLGYIPEDLAGHEALQIVGGKGCIIRLPDYTIENNYELLEADILLHADGTSIVGFTCDHYGARYGDVRSLARKSEKELKDIVAHWIDKKDPQVSDAMAFETKEPVPHLYLHGMMTVTYGDVVNRDKIFISCNPFRKIYTPRLRKDRKRPIVVSDAVTFNDSIRIEIPEGFTYNEKKVEDEQVTRFGSYAFTIEQDGKHLNIKTKVCIKKGSYDISMKDDFVAFREGVAKMLRKVMVIERSVNE